MPGTRGTVVKAEACPLGTRDAHGPFKWLQAVRRRLELGVSEAPERWALNWGEAAEAKALGRGAEESWGLLGAVWVGSAPGGAGSGGL